MDLLGLVMGALDKAEPAGVWLTLLLVARLRSDVKAIKRRLGIVERHQKRASPPEAAPIPVL